MIQFFQRIKRFYRKLFLQPIRVFCIHHVGNEYNSRTTWKRDWIETERFKLSIENLQKEYRFISLTEAYYKICHDSFRFEKYAVLTADDGYRSLLSIIPWLIDHHIPITLFLNGRYLQGESCSPHILELSKENHEKNEAELAKELYLTIKEVNDFNSPLISISSHGYEHIDATKISETEFLSQITRNIEMLKDFPSFIPFHAYTWGRHNEITDAVLHRLKIMPVLMDGQKNYNDSMSIHREEFPG